MTFLTSMLANMRCNTGAHGTWYNWCHVVAPEPRLVRAEATRPALVTLLFHLLANVV